MGSGVGRGPTTKASLPAIKPVPESKGLALMKRTGKVELDAQLYKMGHCAILVGRSRAGWHLSIAHPKRYPTWDEIAKARYELCPADVTMGMLLPPQEEYVNLDDNCFHLWEVTDRRREGKPIAVEKAGEA